MAKPLCVERLSARYRVRRMAESDADEILAFCRSNPQYYEYCGAPVTRESVLRDLALVPQGRAPSDKYYAGFYEGERLAAVLDLVAGYPDARTAFVGFFMTDGARAGQGLGTALVGELAAALKEAGFGAVQLAYEKTNPQASHFWIKNGFCAVREVSHEYGGMVLARRTL